MVDLKGKFAVVTGGAQGLGRAVSQAYAREGMRLAIMDIRGDLLGTLTEDLQDVGAEAVPIQVDLSDAAQTQIAIDRALAWGGTPQVLVHNAALLIQRSMLEITLEQWQRETNIILQAGFQLCKAAWKPMIDAGGGHIILLTSGSGTRGFVKEIAYCPAKHATEGLMKTLALEGAEFNISVNAVTPGAPIHTPMSEQNYDEAGRARWIDPAQITQAFVDLAKQDTIDMTGQRIAARVGKLEILS